MSDSCTRNVSGEGSAPCVSVIVPTYNRAALLKETVDSILAQTYTDFELIIIDNMSEDGTENYVDSLRDKRIRYYRNPNNGVIAANRNYGIRRARGKYVALCDDDDLWVPFKLEAQIPALESDPEIAFCYSNASTFNEHGLVDQWMMKKKVFARHYHHLLIGNFIPNSTVLVRRDLIQQHGYLDENSEFIAVEDYAMWLKLARDHSVVYVDKPLLYYRLHASSISGSNSKMAIKTFRVIRREIARGGFSTRSTLLFLRSALRAAYFAAYNRLCK